MKRSIFLNFVETDIETKKTLSILPSDSQSLNSHHKYFEKRLVWTLIKHQDTKDFLFEAIKEDERKGISYQEIPSHLLSVLNGISNSNIEEEINLKDCFSFDYNPEEQDRLILRSDYTYARIEDIDRPSNRAIQFMAFTFKDGLWEIDTEISERQVSRSISGIVEVFE